MSDVFVSYKAEDRRRVKPLVEALEADGYSVWWDEQIGGGAAWRQAIETELNAAKCVIVAWSKRSVGPEGAFVQDEAARAQQRRVYIPVLIDKVNVPLGFGETQALPLTGWKGDRSDPRYRAVIASVRRLAGKTNSPAAADRPNPFHVSRRAMLGGGAVAGAAVVGIGGWALLAPGSGSPADSIAVLPFANLSGDPSQNWFSDGIAEELRSALGRIAGLKVVGRTSSEAVREEDAETAARKLGVDNILTGSVRQSPTTIRVGTQLVDGRTGIERWSQKYDRAPGDAIKIQTDIAENVARALSIALDTAGRAISLGGTQNPEAQRLLFRAMETVRLNKESLQEAMALADAAIRLDPNYAEAHAQKALFQINYAATYTSSPSEMNERRVLATRTAQAALRIAPNLSTGHRALAEIHRVGLNIAGAQEEFRRALELAPGDVGAMREYAAFLARVGDPNQASELVDQVVSLDPLNRVSYGTRFFVLVAARRYADAVRFAQELERSRPHLSVPPEFLAYALINEGKLEEAASYIERAPADSYNRLVNQAVLLSRTGRAGEVPKAIDSIRRLYGESASYQYAEIYAQIGDKDRAFAALYRGWEFKDPGLLNLKYDKYMDPIRDDPRFAQLLRWMNFPS